MSAELLKISPENPDPAAIRYAAEFIRRGELVAIPTDTFYGIAADPFNLAAVDQIYRVKGRPETRALPILVNTTAQAIRSRAMFLTRFTNSPPNSGPAP